MCRCGAGSTKSVHDASQASCGVAIGGERIVSQNLSGGPRRVGQARRYGWARVGRDDEVPVFRRGRRHARRVPE